MGLENLSSIPLCYATPSAGMHKSHTLQRKLRAIAGAGFPSTEIAFPDLEAVAERNHPGYRKIDISGKGDVDVLCQAAKEISTLCDELNLKVLALQPFMKFEGYEDPNKRQEGLDRAATWFKVMKALNCQMLQVGASDDTSSSSDFNVIARDLRALADLGAAQSPPIRIAYELWAWGTHVHTWEHTWDICKRVDRPNFGLCLDVFHIATRTYLNPDPTSAREVYHKIPTYPIPPALSASLENLTATFSPPSAREKIFYFQISDASGPEKVSGETLLRAGEKKGKHFLYAYSDLGRPLPFMDELDPDAGGYYGILPAVEVIRAVARTGWRGPWSYEAFFEGDMARDDPGIPEKWANAGWASHQKVLKALEANP